VQAESTASAEVASIIQDCSALRHAQNKHALFSSFVSGLLRPQKAGAPFHGLLFFPPTCSCKQASLQLPELWQEAAVLQRLCYKNKNQHKASKHLQAVQQVRQQAAMQLILPFIAASTRAVCTCKSKQHAAVEFI
jgi:hypothetical protein